jgi:predicted MFS family arabinose efflux permease
MRIDPVTAGYHEPTRLMTFTLYAVFGLVAALGGMLPPLLPTLSREFTLTTSDAGTLVGAFTAGIMVSAVASVWVSSRVGLQRTLVAGLALLAATTAGLAFTQRYDLLLALRTAQGVAGAVLSMALAWITVAVRPEQRGRAIGASWAATMLGGVAGPLLAALATAIGRSLTFALAALITAVLAVLASRLPNPSAQFTASPPPLSTLRQPTLLGPLGLTLLPCLLFGALTALMPLRLAALGAPQSTIALLFTVASLIAIPANWFAGWLADRRGRTNPLLWGTALCALSLTAFAPPLSLLWTSVLGLVLGALVALALVPAAAMLDDAGRPLAAATVAPALIIAAVALGQTAGALAGGLLGDLAAPLPYVALALLNVAAFIWLSRHRRHS